MNDLSPAQVTANNGHHNDSAVALLSAPVAPRPIAGGLLSKEQFIAASLPHQKKVEIKELGGAVIIREFNTGEQMAFREAANAVPEGANEIETLKYASEVNYQMLAAALVEPAFTVDEIAAFWQGSRMAAWSELLHEVLVYNGMAAPAEVPPPVEGEILANSFRESGEAAEVRGSSGDASFGPGDVVVQPAAERDSGLGGPQDVAHPDDSGGESASSSDSP